MRSTLEDIGWKRLGSYCSKSGNRDLSFKSYSDDEFTEDNLPQRIRSLEIRTAPVIKDKLLGIVSFTDIVTKTNYSTLDKVKYISKTALPELHLERGQEGEWEVADWEGELENWCSG